MATQRRQQIARQPLQQRRHVAAVDDEIGRIGNRQHERRGVGDEGADEKIRQRLFGLRRFDRRGDGRREHHRGRVVGQKDRDQRCRPHRSAGTAGAASRRRGSSPAPRASRTGLRDARSRPAASCRSGTDRRRCPWRRRSAHRGGQRARARPAAPRRATAQIASGQLNGRTITPAVAASAAIARSAVWGDQAGHSARSPPLRGAVTLGAPAARRAGRRGATPV